MHRIFLCLCLHVLHYVVYPIWYPRLYLLCLLRFYEEFILDLHDLFTLIHQGSHIGTRVTAWISLCQWNNHYNDVTMSTMASQITSLTIVYSTVYSGADQRKHQSSASLAFVRGIHQWPVNSPHKGPVTRKTFFFCDGNRKTILVTN